MFGAKYFAINDLALVVDSRKKYIHFYGMHSTGVPTTSTFNIVLSAMLVIARKIGKIQIQRDSSPSIFPIMLIVSYDSKTIIGNSVNLYSVQKNSNIKRLSISFKALQQVLNDIVGERITIEGFRKHLPLGQCTNSLIDRHIHPCTRSFYKKLLFSEYLLNKVYKEYNTTRDSSSIPGDWSVSYKVIISRLGASKAIGEICISRPEFFKLYEEIKPDVIYPNGEKKSTMIYDISDFYMDCLGNLIFTISTRYNLKTPKELLGENP